MRQSREKGTGEKMEQRQTKERLGQALKKLLSGSSMERITVGEIAAACGMGRQSFYYHFKDKYALLEWMIQNDLETCLEPCPGLEQWQRYTQQMLEHICREGRFYSRVVSGEPQLFLRQCSAQLEKQLNRVLAGENPPPPLVAQRLQFAARFFSYGFAGTLAQWIGEGMKLSPRECILRLHAVGMDGDYLLNLRSACCENLTIPSHTPGEEQV